MQEAKLIRILGAALRAAETYIADLEEVCANDGIGGNLDTEVAWRTAKEDVQTLLDVCSRPVQLSDHVVALDQEPKQLKPGWTIEEAPDANERVTREVPKPADFVVLKVPAPEVWEGSEEQKRIKAWFESLEGQLARKLADGSNAEIAFDPAGRRRTGAT